MPSFRSVEAILEDLEFSCMEDHTDEIEDGILSTDGLNVDIEEHAPK